MNTEIIDHALVEQVIKGVKIVITEVLVWKYIMLCIAINFFIDKATTPALQRKAFHENNEKNKTWAYMLIKIPRSIRAMIANFIYLIVYATLTCAGEFKQGLECLTNLFISMLAVPAVYQYTLKRLLPKNNQ